MKSKEVKRRLSIGIVFIILVAVCFVLVAYAKTWGKTEVEFKIHINSELVMQTVFGESPTFAIWIENPETKETHTVFVTKRAGLDDWEGKVEVPSALPLWDGIRKNEKPKDRESTGIDAVSGATPQPGYFTTKVQVRPGSKWICWIEMNLSGDYNEFYPEYNSFNRKMDEYGNGQPALVYKASIEAVNGYTVVPEVIGMSNCNNDGVLVQPMKGITTALNVFDQIQITIVKPKPKIL